MKDIATRWSSRLPWSLLTGIVVATAVADSLRAVHEAQSPSPAFNAWLEATVTSLTFGTVGALVARHRPHNAVGWLFLGIGTASAIQLLTGEYAMYAHHVRGDRWVGASVSAWVSTMAVATLLTALPLVLLLFPDGRVLSARWQRILQLDLAVGVLLVVSLGFAPGPLGNTEGIANPFGILSTSAERSLAATAGPALLACVVFAMSSMAVRFRRSGPDARQQLKWVAFAGLLGPSSILILTPLLPHQVSGRFGNVLWAAGIGVIPVAAGVSILRYRLYDIDRLISRTVSYAVVTAVLLGVYLVLVTTATKFLPDGSSLAVAASTLAAAALFQPLRRRVQSAVDQRFNRARYDADRTVETFSRRLREQVDLEAVRTDLLTVVHDTLQPATAALWVREKGSGTREGAG